MINHPKLVIKRHLNQIKNIYTADVDQRKEEPMTENHDMFDVSMHQPVQQNRSSKQKQIPTGTMEMEPKRQKYVVPEIYNFNGEMM